MFKTNTIELLIEKAKNDELKSVVLISKPRRTTIDEEEEAFEKSIEKFMDLYPNPKDSLNLLLCDFQDYMCEKNIFFSDYQSYKKSKHSRKIVVLSTKKETIIKLLEWFIEEINNGNIKRKVLVDLGIGSEKIVDVIKEMEDKAC